MEMMSHIVAHSVQVCRVALLLTDHLLKQNVNLNRELIQASALLHDITKTRSFETGENHALTGDQFMSELGCREVGHIIGQHVRLDKYTMTGDPVEAEIVNYADKRVLHDRVVPLGERLNYILEKYGSGPEVMARIRQTWKKTTELENKIFSRIPLEPLEINELLPRDLLDRELSDYRKSLTDCGDVNHTETWKV